MIILFVILLAEGVAPVTEKTEIIQPANGELPTKVTTASKEGVIQTTVIHQKPTTTGSGRMETSEISGAVKTNPVEPVAYSATVDSRRTTAAGELASATIPAQDVVASSVILRSTSFSTTTTTTSA